MKVTPPWVKPARAWALDGRVLPVQCPPILELVPLMNAPTVYLLLGTLPAAEDRGWLYHRIVGYDSTVTDELLGRIADALVMSWCGMPRWFTLRLWQEALGEWARFEGPLTARGVDPAALAPAKATRLVWSTLLNWHGNDKDNGEGWRRRIEAEPIRVVRRAGRRRVPELTAADAAAFASVMGIVGGRAR